MCSNPRMSSHLDSLRQFTTIVADTGDFESIREYTPQDATTNPSLILKAAQMAEYEELVDKVLAEAREESGTGDVMAAAIDKLAVFFGLEILKIVPGRVSTEVDARLSFDTTATLAKARSLIARYEKNGLERYRSHIKIGFSWAGIRAAEELEKEGIKIPNTVYAKDKEQLLHLGKSFPLPYLTKHNRAGRGLGIRLFHDYPSFEKYIKSDDFEDSIDGITLLQEYIKPKTATIIRTEFIDRKFLYAVQVDTSKGFELCPADACNLEDEYCPANATGNKFMILDDFSNPILDQYQKILKNNHIEIAGIEFLEDAKGQLYTYDINTNTNYNSTAESSSEKKGMKAIANFLKKELSFSCSLDKIFRGITSVEEVLRAIISNIDEEEVAE